MIREISLICGYFFHISGAVCIFEKNDLMEFFVSIECFDNAGLSCMKAMYGCSCHLTCVSSEEN